jgi:tetratricopeptide (TPR) repeat protein
LGASSGDAADRDAARARVARKGLASLLDAGDEGDERRSRKMTEGGMGAAALLAKAEEIKAKGNEFFKNGDYKKAITRFARIRAYTWVPSGEARQYGGMGANASREFQYAETETQQLTRLDQIACGNIAQCYLELGQFRKALDFNAKVCGPPCSRGSEAAERQDREAPNPDLHVKALSRSSRCLLAMGDLDGAKDCVLRALGLDPQYKPARALYKKLQEAFREHAAKQKQTLKGAFAADHAITADDRVDLEPDRLPIDEDPSDGA